MLDKHKVLQELHHIVPQVFFNMRQELQCADHCWKWLLDHPESAQSIGTSSSQSIMAHWTEPLDTHIAVHPQEIPYHVLAVDGSQIYPDKHQGIACFLLNIGSVHLVYTPESSRALLNSMPFIITLTDTELVDDFSCDIVNYRRNELELRTGLVASIKARQELGSLPCLFLYDGSLIFWYLDDKDLETKFRFLTSHLAILEQFYNHRLLIAGFISLPKSKELVNSIKAALDQDIIPLPSMVTPSLDHIVDGDIMQSFLQPLHRSALFANRSPIVDYYPDHLKPYFTYVHCVDEIVRIEFPAWIAHDTQAIDTIIGIALDQSNKGRGYPVALAEAHEQAVVKSKDREFFYQMLYKVSLDHDQKFTTSQKSLKKRFVGI
jgi:NurA domain